MAGRRAVDVVRAALVALLAVLALATAGPSASAASGTTNQNRVKALDVSVVTGVGPVGDIGAGQHWGAAVPQLRLAQGRGVHTYYVVPWTAGGGTTGPAVLVHNAGPCDPSNARGLWTVTREGSDRVMRHDKFGSFYRSKSDGTWWTRDTAGHGGSAWKVYDETDAGLVWRADADKYGDYIVGKHKGPTGRSIPWSELAGGQ